MQKSITAFLLTAFAVVSPLAASAAPITVPAGLNPGDQYRLAFVTSTTRNATSLSIGPYNTFVTNVANSVPELAALGTTWRVIGSAGLPAITAKSNTGTGVGTGFPIYRLDGLAIADDYIDLWDGSLDRPLSITEQGQQIFPASPAYVFTGTNASGTPDFVFGGSLVKVGTAIIQYDEYAWIDDSARSNTETLHFYAMSGVLTVVPEPATIFLAAFGFAALAAWGWRRKR